MKLLDDVKVINDNYASQGIKAGAIGTIIEADIRWDEFFVCFQDQRVYDEEFMKNKQNVRFLTQLALLVAIELVLWQTPLGYLRLGALSVSFLTVPVAIGAMIMGPAAGAILGGVFGVTSMVDTFMAPGMKLILFQLNPFGWLMFVLVARILCGLLCGVVFRALNKALKGSTAAYGVGAVSCPFFNTFFFF